MQAAAPLPQRRILGLIFLTVLMDIIGFSIIIPLFPHLLNHYISTEGEQGTLIGMLSSAAEWLGGTTTFQKAVLFGGLLSTLYSLLQFIFSPIWGSLSDRYGRRKILTITLAGNALSYLIWIFAGQFWVVVLTRLISGMMAGNIAVASAAAADVTDENERTKGMAVVGVAIGMGFLVGPVIGGLSTILEPVYAANPFSTPALIAAIMAGLNFILVQLYFPETLAEKNRAQHDAKRPSIFDLANVESRAVRRTSLANLIYQIGFTGMENTVVFLTFFLFAYSALDNVYLFLFNGACLIIAQGLARFMVKKIGQRGVVILGIIFAIIAFNLIAFIPTPVSGSSLVSWGKLVFYIGMGLLSFATGLILPSVSALVSLYSSPSDQGRNLGILRSAGALARVIGPLSAAFLYFKTGSHQWVYLSGALLMFPALWVVRGLPDPHSVQNTKS
jgi:MFS family permease